jgi:hypothetical protein
LRSSQNVLASGFSAGAIVSIKRIHSRVANSGHSDISQVRGLM